MATTLASAMRISVYSAGSYYNLDYDTALSIVSSATVDDISNKTTSSSMGCPVQTTYTFSGSGVHVAGDTGTNAVRDCVGGLTTAPVKFKTINSQMLSGTAIFENFTITADNPNCVRYSFSGRSHGAWAWGVAS